MFRRYAQIVASCLVLCACSPSAEQRAFHESLVKVSAAMAEGVSLTAFSDLVLDARTKFELARSNLSPSVENDATTAVESLEAAKSLWATSLGPYCPGLCTDELKAPLAKLGVPMPDPSTDWENDSFARERFVSSVLAAADRRVEIAIKDLE